MVDVPEVPGPLNVRQQRGELLAYIARHPSLATPAELQLAGLGGGELTTPEEIREAAQYVLRSMSLDSGPDPCGTISMF